MCSCIAGVRVAWPTGCLAHCCQGSRRMSYLPMALALLTPANAILRDDAIDMC